MTYQATLPYLIGLTLIIYAGQAHSEPSDFWTHWSDGQAEVSSYTLTQPRYGEPREGRVDLIYVTEPFSRSKRVKVDRYEPDNPDHIIALKLNIVESWRMGVYEYRLMTSHFFDVQDQLTPLKTTFSSQEWCGVSFEESLWSEGGVSIQGRSYFEGESRALKLPGQPLFTDQLLVWARGLLTGGPATLKALPKHLIESPKRRFLRHRAPERYEASVTLQDPKQLESPLGSVEVYPVRYLLSGGEACTLEVEARPPHRVMGWRCEGGERATLIKSDRAAYWRQTRRSDEPQP